MIYLFEGNMFLYNFIFILLNISFVIHPSFIMSAEADCQLAWHSTQIKWKHQLFMCPFPLVFIVSKQHHIFQKISVFAICSTYIITINSCGSPHRHVNPSPCFLKSFIWYCIEFRPSKFLNSRLTPHGGYEVSLQIYAFSTMICGDKKKGYILLLL